MAYFGGTATERPWPRIDRTAAFLFATCILGLAAYLSLATNIFRHPEPEKIVVIKEVPAEPKATSAMILVAVDNIWPGQKLTQSMLRLEDRPIVGIEDKAFKGLDELRGAYAVTSVAANTPLLKEHISFSPPSNILTARIPEGFRAVSISVNAETGVEGWARPGARVDVVWTSTHRGRMIVSTIVENAQVLSAERSVESLPQGSSTSVPLPTHITLLVALKDAQKVQLAKASGALSLNLRGDLDSGQSGSGTLTVDNLLRRQDIRDLDEAQGRVRIDGKDFVMKGNALVPATTVTAP